MTALSAKNAATRIALVVAAVAAAGLPAQAVNDSMTDLNSKGEVAFVESPGEDVNDNAGISLKFLKNGGKTVLVSNGDLLPAHCIGGTNSGDGCTSDSDCPSGSCERPVVSGFARRVQMNDSGLIAVRVGGTNPDEFNCEDGTNNNTPCTSDADCTGGGTCTDDPDTEGVLITAALGSPASVIARTCDTVGSDDIHCPDADADINNAGQVGFSAQIQPAANNFCDNLPGTNSICNDGTVGDDRAIYRFTPGTGIELMLRDGDMINGKTVADVEDDAEMINAAGFMVQRPEYTTGDRAVVLLKGPGSNVEIAAEGVAGITEVETGILNSAANAQVLYKSCTGGTQCSNSTAEHLNIFTDGSGSVSIADEDDPLPSGGGQFEGFGKFYCLNDAGQAAFVAGIKNTPTGTTPTNFSGGGDFDPQPQGLYFWNGTSLTEVARTASADNGTFVSSFNGFRFDWFVNAVVLNATGTLCFAAEQAAPANTTSDNEPSAVFCWDQATGIREIYRDGNFVVESGDTALVPAMQTMKNILNDNGDMAFVVDPTGSQDESDDNFVLFTTFLRASQVAPALSWGAMGLAVVMIVGAGYRSIRRRGV